jgi:hypothetical protein
MVGVCVCRNEPNYGFDGRSQSGHGKFQSGDYLSKPDGRALDCQRYRLRSRNILDYGNGAHLDSWRSLLGWCSGSAHLRRHALGVRALDRWVNSDSEIIHSDSSRYVSHRMERRVQADPIGNSFRDRKR